MQCGQFEIELITVIQRALKALDRSSALTLVPGITLKCQQHSSDQTIPVQLCPGKLVLYIQHLACHGPDQRFIFGP